MVDVREPVTRAEARSAAPCPRLRASDECTLIVNPTDVVADRHRFRNLGAVILPRLLSEHSPLRVWSAGCSLVFEPYSLAWMLAEQAPGEPHFILATDADERMLRLVQSRASWPANAGRAFGQAQGAVRSMLRFSRQDLLTDSRPAGPFDLVLYRDALSSFAEDARGAVYRRLAAVLRSGGVLLLGATARVSEPASMDLSPFGPGLYRKVSAA